MYVFFTLRKFATTLPALFYLEKWGLFIGGGVIQEGNTIFYSENVELIDFGAGTKYLESTFGKCFFRFKNYFFQLDRIKMTKIW